MKATNRIDPFKGVVNPDTLVAALKRRDTSYVRGSLQVLERKPPNPFIVPLLKKALERFRVDRD
jgi:hypothetical protein